MKLYIAGEAVFGTSAETEDEVNEILDRLSNHLKIEKIENVDFSSPTSKINYLKNMR